MTKTIRNISVGIQLALLSLFLRAAWRQPFWNIQEVDRILGFFYVFGVYA
jgi:hypothetical protein